MMEVLLVVWDENVAIFIGTGKELDRKHELNLPLKTIRVHNHLTT